MKNDPRNSPELLKFCDEWKKQYPNVRPISEYQYKFGKLEYYCYYFICKLLNKLWFKNKELHWICHPNFQWLFCSKKIIYYKPTCRICGKKTKWIVYFYSKTNNNLPWGEKNNQIGGTNYKIETCNPCKQRLYNSLKYPEFTVNCEPTS